MWICEFCEYEDIFGVPPVAMIRRYEIKDRQERKKAAERRRLLEKAKMKGRKGKKGKGKGGNAAGNNANGNQAAAANGHANTPAAGDQQYDPNMPPPPAEGVDGEEEYFDDEDEYDEDYDDQYEPVEGQGGGGGHGHGQGAYYPPPVGANENPPLQQAGGPS
jgi:hypothetical protein